MNYSRTGAGTPSTRSGFRFAPLINTLGVLFAAAAFLCALPYCTTQLHHWPQIVAYWGIAAALTYASTRMPPRFAFYGTALFSVALAVRLAWALHASFPPLGDDYEHYRSVSLDLLQGKWDELYYTFWPWGYFLYLGALAWLFGTSLTVPVVANAIAGSLTTLLVYAIARRFFEARGARIAAGIYALWPGVVYWSSVLCTEIPHLLFFLAALLCLLVGLEAKTRSRVWLVAGGFLATLAEFFRALSPLLLLPFAIYACTRKNSLTPAGAPARSPRGWREVAIVLGTYAICLGALLTVESGLSGYPNYSTSHTLGMNLAFGLNWESQGTFNANDALAIYSDDPREANRRGMKLAMNRLKAMWGSNWWRFPLLAALKFRQNWSLEAAGYDATYNAVPDDQRERHWLTVYGDCLEAVAQWFHSLILALAAIGFWQGRRSGGLALLAGILLAFVLLHTVMEVDSRYHFAAQSLLAIASAGAFKKNGKLASTIFCLSDPTKRLAIRWPKSLAFLCEIHNAQCAMVHSLIKGFVPARQSPRALRKSH